MVCSQCVYFAGYEWAPLDSQTQKVPVGAVRVDPKEEVYVGKAWTQKPIQPAFLQSGSQDIGDEHICKFVNNGQSNFCVPYQGKEYNNMRLGHILRCHSPDQVPFPPSSCSLEPISLLLQKSLTGSYEEPPTNFVKIPLYRNVCETQSITFKWAPLGGRVTHCFPLARCTICTTKITWAFTV